MASTSIGDMLSALGPDSGVSIGQLLHFITLATKMRHDIAQNQNASTPTSFDFDGTQPPLYLDPDTRLVLEQSLQLPSRAIESLWSACRLLIWSGDAAPDALQATDASVLLASTMPNDSRAQGRGAAPLCLLSIANADSIVRLNLALMSLYPPSLTCPNDLSCKDLPRLEETDRKNIVVFTHADGPVPGYATSLYCRGGGCTQRYDRAETHVHYSACSTTFHNNYAVNSSRREYYTGVPKYIQVADHVYVEDRVINQFISSMLLAWTSARNCANIYNTSNPPNAEYSKLGWPLKLELRSEHVWDAFVLLALLEDRQLEKKRLVVPNDGEQSERFLAAMQERNLRMRTVGQPELRHTCAKCVKVRYSEKEQKLSES